MPTAPPTRRRWFQFGLGTMLLLVTVLALFIAYHVNWVRERRAAIASWESSRWFPSTPPVLAKPPWLLSLFGEPGYGCLWRESSRRLGADEEAELERVQRLFPEAKVVWAVYP